MATYVQTMSSAQSPHQQYGHLMSCTHRKHPKQKFVADLSQCLFDFVIQLLPTAEEMAVKEDVRKLLERLIRTIEPDSRLLSFGSTANGFSLRNSDMDLCCLIDSDERLAATDLVTMLGDLLERETKFHVKPLPHARIPIVKLSLDPSPGLPLGIACDIGFENRLALENTRLLMCYAMIDPTRVRTMVLFLKVWSKRRKINSPYQGTLSSYGYVLLVIYFLVHVKNPPVLPNLQQMPPMRPISQEETHMGGHNTWFFDDIELLRQRWQSSNMESVAELLIDFFRYYSRDFLYNTGVASIRAGLLKKETKGWQNDLSSPRYNDARERNRFCIEDPFEIDFNVARCVTKDGLYTIRGEFMRASRILATRPERAIVALAQLCEERKETQVAQVSPPPAIFIPPRLSSIPPQTPYTVGSNSGPKGLPSPDRITPEPQLSKPATQTSTLQHVPSRSPPEHMAPKRREWTSPPPPEASHADHTSFEDKLGLGLELATSSTDAREREEAYTSSSSNSEILSDDEPRSDIADDVRSVHSFTEGSSPSGSSFHRPSWHITQDSPEHVALVPSSFNPDVAGIAPRGRYPARITDKAIDIRPPKRIGIGQETPATAFRTDAARRSNSGPPRTSKRSSWPSMIPIALVTPLPPSPSTSPVKSESPESSTVFYETGSCHPPVLYPNHVGHSSTFSYQQHLYHPGPAGITSDNASDQRSPTTVSRGAYLTEAATGRSSVDCDTPTPYYSRPTHNHSQSNATITAPTPKANISQLGPNVTSTSSRSLSRSRSRSESPSLSYIPSSQRPILQGEGTYSSLASTSCGSDSPTPSSTSSATSLSPSPPSSGAEEDYVSQSSSGKTMETQSVASKPTKSPAGGANAHNITEQ